MRRFPVNFWNSLLTTWIKETKPIKTKQATDYLRQIIQKQLPELVLLRAGVGCDDLKGPSEPISLENNTWSSVLLLRHYRRTCVQVTGLPHARDLAGLDKQFFEICWLLSLSECVTLAEIQHWYISPNSGQLVKNKTVVGLTYANSSAYAFVAHQAQGSSLLLYVRGWLWGKICFQLVWDQNQQKISKCGEKNQP